MASISSRRSFVKHAAVLVAGAHARPWVRLAAAAQTGSVIAETSAGKVRGVVAAGRQDLQRHSVRWNDGRQKPLHAADETDAVDRHAGRPRLWTQRAARQRECRAGISSTERGLPGAERLYTGARRRKESARDGVAARRRLFHGFGLATHPRRHQPGAHQRRGGRHHQPPVERARLHLPG